MVQRKTVDNMIRSTLRANVKLEEPAAAVRETLLAAAASENAFRSAVGPTVPPLVEDLQERNEPAVDWSTQVTTAIPLARKQLLLLAAPLYAVR